MLNYKSNSVNLSQVQSVRSKQNTRGRLPSYDDLKLVLTVLVGALIIGCVTAIVLVPCIILLGTKPLANTLFTSNSLGIYNLNIPTCATWNQNATTVAGNANGSSGTDLGSLSSPTSIFVDNINTLYISDRDNNRVMKYLDGASTGIVVAGNLTNANAANTLNSPKGVAVDRHGSIFVADSGNYRIQQFSSGSMIGVTLTSASTLHPLGITRSVSIDMNDNIYVADSDNSQIIKYTSASPIGVILAGGITAVGLGTNQLDGSYGSFMDGSGNLYVADTSNQRIIKFLSGSLNGTVVAGITGIAGPTLAFLSNPDAVIVDNNGYVYVADGNNNRIVKWTANYSAGGVCVVGCSSTSGTAAYQLHSPRDLKFDRYGNLYVADQSNNRVQKFMIQIPSACPSSS